MRLPASRRRHARPGPPRSAVRALLAGAGGSLLVIALSGSAGAGVFGPPGAGGPPHYVALGDSYTTGPFIPDQTGSPAGCLRSTHSYPFLVAAGTGAASFSDVSCRGATTADITRAVIQIMARHPASSERLAHPKLVDWCEALCKSRQTGRCNARSGQSEKSRRLTHPANH